MEKTIELEIPLLLPNVKDEQDECLNRLEVSLQNQRGILRAHLEREKTPVDLCLHYDPNLLTLEQVKRLAQRAGAGIANRYHHLFTPIEGMDCSDCVTVIEHGLGRMDGVLAVNVNYAAASLRVEYDKHKVDRPAIEKRVQSLGYEIPAEGFRSWYKENREIVFSLTAGLLLIIGWLGETFFGLPAWIATTLYIGGYVFGGWDISQHAWHAIKEKHFDTDLLMVMAALGAAFLGEFAEGALLLFLFSLGHALEERALDRARAAVRALADLAPKTALVRRDGKEQELPVESLQLEDVVIVRPGVRIPVDGVILIGNSGVDQASVTGESLPVDKVPGDQVFASTVNGEGALEVKVTRLAKDSTLARVMKMVEEAQAQKSPTQQTVEKFERVFVPAVLIVTALVIIVPPLLGFPFHESFLRAMTLLVAASPCALALGTPATILAGVAQAARNGVLVKGGAHLENLGRLKAIAFDKTGTVTHGRPEVTDLVVFPDSGWKEDDVVSLVAGAESRSAHPLAQAVVRSAQSLPVSVMDEVESLTGRGLRAVSNGKTIWIGNRKLMDEAMVTIPADALQKADTLQQSGKTLMWIAEDKTVIGLIALADTLRHEAAPTMKALKQTGVAHTIMLTGDNTRSASAIAKEIGLTEYRADLMPADKLTVIRDLVKEYGQVAMIGDGVNDAPALANATVGIAMGGAGTDVALETADVALMGDDLSKLPFAVGLGRATRNIIVQNLFISLGVIALLIVTSLTGIVSIGIAIVFHEGSTLVVVANALRLLGYKEKHLAA
ncbi:MAG: cadmium-translocating P-type ATPase [Chloroflexota bacterium]|jgi:Cd2+/Zn2+-exporting ATPase|nr:cadmium-translocating P-type ATPase [Chloroflexota bacterium]MBI5705008.1 cadmium-translocating P-type ATPase [Chloroflexota bacterium]RJP47056.1 MAG: cadmium-translocating P-type ATPase [Anaerolineaceae bacterium]